MGAKPMSMQALSSVYTPFRGEMKYMHKTWHQKRTCQIICNKLTVQHWQYRRTYGYMESMCYRVSATNYFHLFSTPSVPNYKVYYYFQEIKLFYVWPSFLWKKNINNLIKHRRVWLFEKNNTLYFGTEGALFNGFLDMKLLSILDFNPLGKSIVDSNPLCMNLADQHFSQWFLQVGYLTYYSVLHTIVPSTPLLFTVDRSDYVESD